MAPDSSEVRNLTRQEYRWLLEGLSIDQPKAIRSAGKKRLDLCAKGRKFFFPLWGEANAEGRLSTCRRNRQDIRRITLPISRGFCFYVETRYFFWVMLCGNGMFSTFRLRQMTVPVQREIRFWQDFRYNRNQ